MPSILSFSLEVAYSISLLTLAVVIWHQFVKPRLWHRVAENPEAFSKNVTDEQIVPLPDFDWKTTQPLQYRPYKPKFYMSMGSSLQSPVRCSVA